MAEGSHIPDDVRAAIGKESEPEIYEIDKTGVRMFARAVGYTDREFYDEDYAKSLGHRSLPVPPGFFGQAVFDPARSSATSSRRPSVVSLPFKRNLNGGNEYEYRGSICAGDVLSMTEVISNIVEREGKMGPMLITTRDRLFRNQTGEIVLVARGTSISY